MEMDGQLRDSSSWRSFNEIKRGVCSIYYAQQTVYSKHSDITETWKIIRTKKFEKVANFHFIYDVEGRTERIF